jgi:hypothetical protein
VATFKGSIRNERQFDGTSTAWAELSDVEGWRVGVTFERGTGEILRVQFERTGDDYVPVGAALRAVNAGDVARLVGGVHKAVFGIPPASQRAADRNVELATVASLYVTAVKAGERAPRKVVARRLRKTPEQVRDLLNDARRAQPPLLEGGSHGSAAGWKLTDATIEILARTGATDP